MAISLHHSKHFIIFALEKPYVRQRVTLQTWNNYYTTVGNIKCGPWVVWKPLMAVSSR